MSLKSFLDPPRRGHKRRRSESIDGSHKPVVHNKGGRALEDRLSNPSVPSKSKRARKRQSRAEKTRLQQHINLQMLQPLPSMPPGLHLTHDMSPFDYVPFNPEFSLNPSLHYPASNYLPPPPPPHTNWVESMAAAAPQAHSVYPPFTDTPQVFYPASAPEPMLPPPKLPPPPMQAVYEEHHVRPPPTFPNGDAHTLPPKPPAQPSLPIGMKPDQDPSSKHGIFKLDGTDGKNAGYIPNPARTLVMEQLPKSHRNADFINSWGRKACGVQPVKIIIDSSAAKALVEFSTSGLARKAWDSPRLGAAYIGLKSHQLKGKPREDLIRVWWYRVDGVGAESGVGEIEEGEIVGDPPEPEDPKQQTKRQKKARLHERRLAKAKQQAELWHEAEFAPQAEPHRSAVSPHIPQQSIQFPNPPSAYPMEMDTTWYSAILPRATPHIQTSNLASYKPSAIHSQNTPSPDDEMVSGEDDMDLSSPVHPQGPSSSMPTTLARNGGEVVHRPLLASNGDIRNISSPTLPVPVAPLTEKRVSPTESTSSNLEEMRRSLAARQKELETGIAFAKKQLANKRQDVTTPLAQTSQSSGSEKPPPATATDKRALELRELVLQSRRHKMAATAANASNQPTEQKLTSNASTATTQNSSVPIQNKDSAAANNALSLEALAVSFISQTIETAKVRAKSPPRPKSPPAPMITKTSKQAAQMAELETKRRLLEREIEETKKQMALKLSKVQDRVR
ncbi:hypothetical protein FA15DRAFT_667278 [Coprinopsis marcescibilis]|uniref:Uncharacterized protein n=1 Tax=Coprinopsis marcescibilis TaxID=230819 RepID=A0A5C3L0Y0_COPMA|nr:hypothetical protein FA15DRAFT_667278 [Coprinopsis marcescibilis]